MFWWVASARTNGAVGQPLNASSGLSGDGFGVQGLTVWERNAAECKHLQSFHHYFHIDDYLNSN